MNNSCLNCDHCGGKRGSQIRCDHPSWEDETEMRYVDPTFAEACEDFSPAGEFDEDDEDDGDEDDYSPVEPYHDEDGCPST